ncbi:MAG: hypothetical protein Q4D04_02035 [Clostridia bacterium]|nr:hypothetical protein [Clostridia bacterium]
MAFFGNMMHRFYYGKAGQADYTVEQLPANRTTLFFEMLRVRFTGIIGVNALYLLFCLPAIIWTALTLGAAYTISADSGTVDVVQSGLLFNYLLILIPFMGLAGVGATGEMYVLRNWARDEHSFVMSDFGDAVKGNWKMGLAVGLINGASLFLAAVCYSFYGQMMTESPVWVIPQMISVMICGVWWMMNMIMFPMLVTYDMKLRHVIKNSAIMVIARLPWSVLFLVGTVGVPAVIAVFVPYGYIAAIIVYLVLGFGLTGFIYASYANSCFDKYLNPRIEGAKVNQGLRDPEADDLSDVEDDNPLV